VPAGPHPRPDGATVVTGAAGALGRRVVGRLAGARPGLVAVDRRWDGDSPLPAGVEVLTADLATADLSAVFDRARTVVHLAFATAGGGEDDVATARTNVAATRRVLEAADKEAVQHLVVLSSSTVYGAWPANPVPLTEQAPLRPNPGFGYAAAKAEVERLCAEWADDHPGATVAMLRPAPTLGDEHESWLSSALRQASGVRAGDVDPPAQFLDIEDLAAAVELATEKELDGAYNVAPDGWISGDEVRALAGAPPRVRVPVGVARAVAAVAWRWRVARTPPGLIPYTMHPWVVANDRLKAEGWAPGSSSAETYVAAHEGTPWSRLSPKRRQELALGVSAAALVGSALAVGLFVRRRIRKGR
jgi:nucleoside-diphosphate-sugar epimerase